MFAVLRDWSMTRDVRRSIACREAWEHLGKHGLRPFLSATRAEGAATTKLATMRSEPGAKRSQEESGGYHFSISLWDGHDLSTSLAASLSPRWYRLWSRVCAASRMSPSTGKGEGWEVSGMGVHCAFRFLRRGGEHRRWRFAVHGGFTVMATAERPSSKTAPPHP